MFDQAAVMRNNVEVSRLLVRHGATSLHAGALVSCHRTVLMHLWLTFDSEDWFDLEFTIYEAYQGNLR